MTRMGKAVFLDRDGVLNESLVRDGRPFAPTCLEEFKIIDGAAEAVIALNKAGFLTIIVTNQPDVGNGLVDQSVVDTIHQYLSDKMPLSDVKVCFHTAKDHCSCRKPLPGMLKEAAGAHQIDLGASFLVGDRWRDIDTANSVGVTSFFIDYGYSEELNQLPDYTVESLAEATRIILSL